MRQVASLLRSAPPRIRRPLALILASAAASLPSASAAAAVFRGRDDAVIVEQRAKFGVRCIPKVAFQPELSRHLNRRDRRAIMAEVAGIPAAAPPFLHRRLQSDPLQMAHAVRREKHAGPDLADRGRLFVDGNLDPLGDQRFGRELAADTASDDHDTGRDRTIIDC
jgi:hypothetical protein